MERRLTAIVAADIVGYSQLMGADQTQTLEALRQLREETFDPIVATHRGRIIKRMGDGWIVEFPSISDAVACSISIQNILTDHDTISLRIGIHIGEVVFEADDVFGDGVNIAARLENIANPGEVLISDTARDSLDANTADQFSDGEKHRLKNIARPVVVWRWANGKAPDAKTTPALAVPDKPSIAVLPFDNLSSDPDQDYFADGVVEALTAALSQIRAFFVIARNSAFAYKDKHANVVDIGRDLGVAYVLEGSVQRAGNRVRITVQLIETENGSHIWAEKYDGSLDDIFDLQDRITEQVAGALQPSIRSAEIERARRKPPQDLNAYDFAMRAMRHVWMLEQQEVSIGLELLKKSLEADPDYPLALALSAWCHAQRSVYNWDDDINAARALALSHAERAANLSSDDPLILAVLGTVHTFARNFGAARVLLERAVALDANAAWAWSRIGWLEVYADRPDQAKKHFEKALRLSPLDPMNFNNYVGIGSAYMVGGEDNMAADSYLRALQERPNAIWIHRNLAPALFGAGRIEEAQASFAKMIDAYPDITVKKINDAMVFSEKVLERVGIQLAKLGLPEE